MLDHSKILKHIQSTSDQKSLKTIIKNAREQGAAEVEEAAFRKLISIVPEAEPGTVEHDFWTTVHAFEFALSEERGRTTKLTRTRQKVTRVGVMDTLEDWAFGKQTTGFDMLVERGMPELTGEAIVVRHSSKFSDEVVAAARQRLAAVGHNLE
ncbi:MAG: hypothetical protein ABJ215_00245 [Alphaproteobacteria bacterium]